MNSLASTSVTLVTTQDSFMPPDMAEHPKKSFSSRKLAMEIRMQRLKSGLTNVPSRLLHRQQYHIEHRADNLLECLIDDILIYIGETFLSPRDLWSFSQVSRRCASLFLPLMYTNIDLRLRRIYEVDIKSKGLARNGNNRESVLLAQRRLRKNLNRYPHLSLRVRTLRWYLDDREMRTNFWDILKNMINVETLLVCSPYGSPYCPDSETIDQYSLTPGSKSTRSITSTTSSSISSSSSSSTLFSKGGNGEVILPHCRHLTLQGIISLPLAKHIISPTALESFSIDCTAQWTSPILSYLSSSPASFPRLTNLTLIFPCGKALPESSEIVLLKSWHQVLYAYHTTLSQVTISSRLASQRLGIYTGPPLIRPSFSLLKTHIFGLFLGETVIHDDDDQSIRRELVKWEKLKVLTLKGKNMVDKTGDVFQRLYMAVPELVIDPSIDTEDTLWHNQFAYSVLLR